MMLVPVFRHTMRSRNTTAAGTIQERKKRHQAQEPLSRGSQLAKRNVKSPAYLAFFSAASILAMYLAVSFLKSLRQDLQHSFTSRPS